MPLESGSDELLEIIDGNPFWTHTGDKRIKFSIDENRLMYIEKDANAIVSTAKNIQVKGKGDLIFKALGGEAITAPNGYTVLGGDGVRNISNCVSGVTTSSLRFGEDPDDIDEKFASTPSKRGAAEGAIYLCDNDTDITLTNTDELITYKDQIIATQYYTGIALLGTLVEATMSSKLVAQTGPVLQKEGLSYMNTALVYAGANNLLSDGIIHQYERPVSINDIVPSIEEGAATSWIVYSGDGYSKQQVNENFVSKSEYNEALATIAGLNTVIEGLTARIAALEEGIPSGDTGTNANVTEDGDLSLDNVTLENGDLDLGSSAKLYDDGLLEL